MEERRIFNMAQAAAVSGVKPETQRAWKRRGHVTLGDRYERYTLSDVAVLMVMNTMPRERNGLSAAFERAVPIAEEIVKAARGTGAPKAQLAVFYDGASAPVWTDKVEVDPNSWSAHWYNIPGLATRLRLAVMGAA